MRQQPADKLMQNFRLIEESVQISPLLTEIDSVEGAWDLNQGRQSTIKVQREAKAIPIRGLRKSKIAGRKKWDVHESRFTTISQNFPVVRGEASRVCWRLLSVRRSYNEQRKKQVFA